MAYFNPCFPGVVRISRPFIPPTPQPQVKYVPVPYQASCPRSNSESRERRERMSRRERLLRRERDRELKKRRQIEEKRRRDRENQRQQRRHRRALDLMKKQLHDQETQRIIEKLSNRHQQDLLNQQHQQALVHQQYQQALLNQQHQQALLNQQHQQDLLNQQHQQALLNQQHQQDLLNQQHQQALLNQQHQQELLNQKYQRDLLQEQHSNVVNQLQAQLREKDNMQLISNLFVLLNIVNNGGTLPPGLTIDPGTISMLTGNPAGGNSVLNAQPRGLLLPGSPSGSGKSPSAGSGNDKPAQPKKVDPSMFNGGNGMDKISMPDRKKQKSDGRRLNGPGGRGRNGRGPNKGKGKGGK
ncbi:hypothetical protein ACRALDRAFT_205249 [Sodiomyces alcalophilus JCM 7366]|uniref:uncharacterized protein n=1 Tax=Sodiomyces alcalophilus JCM 7366 TaxID=591952 RepID=UPI0039B6E3E7